MAVIIELLLALIIVVAFTGLSHCVYTPYKHSCELCQ